jgi:uncharacterized protein
MCGEKTLRKSAVMEDQHLIAHTEAYVKKELSQAEGGHDWWHIERVWRWTKRIAEQEKANVLICELAALLHDIADSKFHNGDEEIGPRKAKEFLEQQGVAHDVVEHVVQIIRNISFKGGKEQRTFDSLELRVVQDADRLDAIGAVGIARAFNYGGFKNRALFDPTVPPNLSMTKEEYKKGAGPTINHFYEKLLLLKDLMNTSTGKALAEDRHRFMLQFLDQFFAECGTFT